MVEQSSDSTSEAAAEVSFRDLALSDCMLAAIEAAGYTTATPIQAQAIPPLLAGRDVLGQAQTGTGKTAAFALPMLQRIDLAQQHPQVLVFAPTRELAMQVAESFQRYAAGLRGLRVVPIYGGQDYQVQFRELHRGAHVIVGTPGRIVDHIRRGSISLAGLRGLVLDEADEMLRMGFTDDVDWVLSQAPPERQTALFSATMPETIRQIAQRHLRNPVEINIRRATAETIQQRYLIAPPHQKEEALARILEAEASDGVLVFVKTKAATEPLADFLTSHGHRAAALSSDVAQKQRERILEQLRSGVIDIIVATDVAARGLDVQRISHVINYDLPFDTESYVHRIGRTGRAGREGQAILFLHPRERYMLERIERATRQTIPQMEVPSKRVINRLRVAKFHDKITENLTHPAMDTFVSLIEQYRAKNDVPMEQIAAALMAMAVGDVPLLLTEDLPAARFAEPKNGRRPDRGPGNFRTGGRAFSRDSREAPNYRRPQGGRSGGQMETFRIEVGRVHRVNPGNIVGAIANEAGLENRDIGRINIYDQHSTVDLRAGLPREVFHALKHVRVAGRKLNISRLGDSPTAS